MSVQPGGDVGSSHAGAGESDPDGPGAVSPGLSRPRGELGPDGGDLSDDGLELEHVDDDDDGGDDHDGGGVDDDDGGIKFGGFNVWNGDRLGGGGV